MNKILLSLTLLLPLSLGAETFNYGFCPEDVTEEESIAHGSGKNNDIEVMMRLSPAEMPQIAALKGSKITGVRAMLRNDVERKAAIIARIGSLEAEVIKKDCWLNAGWNEVRFSEPIEIGDEDIYIGYRANETQGSGHHPVVASKMPAPSSTFFLNVNLSGWQDMSTKGAIMVQAIIDGDATILETPAATATVSDFPQLVAPLSPFQATVTIKNLSSKPVSTLTVDYCHGSVELEKEIAPFEVSQSVVTLMTDEQESTDRPFITSVSRINGQDIEGYKSTTHLYVTRDVFTRIPLIEEWTSQTCPNCPFMAYYLEEAREIYNKPHTYVTHHDGFAKDKMTKPIDTELLFLFGDPSNQLNPAIMYDRSYLPGETKIIFSALNEIGPRQYLERILAAEMIPALAEVNVSIDEKDVTVKGKVSTGPKTEDGKVFISAYLIEDDIKPTDKYLPQLGVNAQVAPDAPADMVKKFRHNGVIRANLTTVSTGDHFDIDPEGYYEVHYTLPDFQEDWNADNLHVVSLIHRFDPTETTDNYVLNSGDSKPFEASSLREISTSKETLRAVRSTDGRIIILTPIEKAEVFDLQGRKLNLNTPAPAGPVIIRATLPDGQKITAKIK
ncbi:MAG: Omp28-related outer membrane protein [Muribaculaceae bacterium]|nr:Omp28-related outer membrane protein [Muribaculaceae bacterium]